MTDLAPILVGVISMCGVLVAASLGAIATLGVALVRWRAENRLLWRHNRELVDHIYRGLGPPPPTAPTDLFD